MNQLRLALAQLNPTVGDLTGNRARAVEALHQARQLGADLVVFPELYITGYPPEDLLLKPQFVTAAGEAVSSLLPETKGLIAIIGFPHFDRDVYNSAAVMADGKLLGIYNKNYLPNYGVFDENRYFAQGKESLVFELDGLRFGVSICEDLWYQGGVPHEQALLGDCQLLVNLSSSPYYKGKCLVRERMLATRAADDVCALAYCNLVGGQDELVFDGHSLVLDHLGNPLLRAPQFEEGVFAVDVDIATITHARLRDPRRRQDRKALQQTNTLPIRYLAVPSYELTEEYPPLPEPVAPKLEELPEVASALRLGIRDYVDKNGFKRIGLGLSGGIDSALVAVLAAQALGKERVVAFSMPSQYSSDHSKTDAAKLAENLAIEYHTIALAPLFEAFRGQLAPLFKDLPEDLAEQNLQARLRANLLMAWSNKFGGLILVTGNKSETSVGYSTLYGDMAGGFAPIKDVPKTLVYALAEHLNTEAGYDLIPRNIIEKAPSAELKPDQFDQDDLPPYDLLDELIELYVEQDLDARTLVEKGYDEALVRKVTRMIDRSEYKRRQAPPGVKITPRAFGKDRRMPITSKYHEL